MSCDRRCFDPNDPMFDHEDCNTCPGADRAPGVRVIVTDAAPEDSLIVASLTRDPATGVVKILDAVRVINVKP